MVRNSVSSTLLSDHSQIDFEYSWVLGLLETLCTSQYVVLNNQKNYSTEGLLGVLQGIMLAPLFLLLYMNYLRIPALVHNRIKLYADDVLLHFMSTW